MVEVEQWAELRRLHFVRGVSIRELQRRSGLGRNTIRRALRADAPPRYERRPAPSKLEPFKPEVKRLLREEPKLPGVRVFEELCELGFMPAAPGRSRRARESREAPCRLSRAAGGRAAPAVRRSVLTLVELLEPDDPVKSQDVV